MTSYITTLVRFFMAPAEPAAFAPPRARPVVAGVLANELDLLVAAGCVAASLRREARSPAVLVCVWRGHDDPPLPAPAPGGPGASRLASKLVRRGIAARACGVTCVVELPADPDAAIAVFRDAAAAADAPVVLALARRDAALDPWLAATDRLVLAVADDADAILASLALAGLGELGPAAERIPLPRGVIVRHAARLGLTAPAAPEPAPREAAAATLQERLS